MAGVSVVIPSFNAEDSIERAVCSALTQTHENVEVIVIDDASLDGTVRVLRGIQDERLHVIQHFTNHGPSAARNAGIEAARGDWIALLDADDWWDTGRLEQLLTLAAETEAVMVADNQRLYVKGSSRPYGTRFKDGGVRLEAARVIGLAEYLERSLGILQPIINRRFLERHNLFFDEARRYGEDFLLFAECLFEGARLVVTPEPYYNCVISDASLTGSRTDVMAGMREIYDELIQHEVVRTLGLDQLLSRKIKKIDESLVYSAIMDKFKQGAWASGLTAVVSNPWFFILAIQRIPRSIRYRFARGLN